MRKLGKRKGRGIKVQDEEVSKLIVKKQEETHGY